MGRDASGGQRALPFGIPFRGSGRRDDPFQVGPMGAEILVGDRAVGTGEGMALPVVDPLPVSTLTTPAGSTWARSLASSSRDSGVSVDGLMTTQLPAARAGESFQAAMGELELGADAVGGGHEHRLLAGAGFELEQPAEAADIGQDTLDGRPGHEGLDARNQGVAGVDIHAGRLVGCRSVGHG